MTKRLFDAAAFGARVAKRVQERKLSFRAAAREMEIGVHVLLRVINHKQPNVESYFRIMNWLLKTEKRIDK